MAPGAQQAQIPSKFTKAVVADPPLSLTQALQDRYRLERELGRGGMATVYLAHDLKHDRPVALKVLHPELAAALGPERFQREIRLAARLQHPNILSVHDSGETAGQLWFTMPLVEGESLRDRLRREQQLPVEVALRIATDAARALQYAHDHGVIHRDIKPENLLLTNDGSTLVADFGIARALSGGDNRLTETGMSVGTPTYMSPEQASADRQADGRTDVYSLGTVLFEMLAGEPPFTGPTVQAILARRFTGDIPRVRPVRPAVPDAVEQAILKALAPVPADRYATAADFARALVPPAPATPVSTAIASTGAVATTLRKARRGVPTAAWALGLGFLIGLGVLFAWRRSHAGEETTEATRLAVLPFENLGRTDEEYFADGLTDAVRGKLAALPGLQVTARSSSSQYKHTTKSPQQIGQELGVRYLLTGTVRWEKGAGGQNRVQVSPELVQVSTASTKWQEPFDAALTDVFQVQADVAARVAQALGATLGSGEREALETRPTRNLAAYDAFLKGEEISNSLGNIDPTVLRRALGYYEEAVALDSTFSLAWAQLSRTHSALYGLSEPTPQGDRAAREAADRALALAPDRPEGRLALGIYYESVQRDKRRALEQYTLGQRHAANNADLLAAAAFTEEGLGRWDEAVEHYRRAQSLDPASVATTRRLARVLMWLKRYPEALGMSDRAVALAPANPIVIQTKVEVHLAQGDLPGAQAALRAVPDEVEPTALVAFMATYDDLYWVLDEAQQQLLLRLSPRPFDSNRTAWGLALAGAYALRHDRERARAYADSARIAFEQQLRAAPQDPQLRVLFGLALAYLGRKADAIREGEYGLELLPVSKDAFGGPYQQLQLVRIYLLLGEPERALDQLEPLLKIPYRLSPGWLRIDPTFAPLRGNPRFERLIQGTS
jgi:TolB-like protein